MAPSTTDMPWSYSMKNRYIRFIPNTLSSLRLLLAALFPFFPATYWFWLIIIGGCSDILDGWLARRWQVQSWLGGIIDAVADKLFVLVALLTLAGSGRFSFWWVPLLVMRDLLVACTAIYAVSIRSWKSFKKMEVRWSGKTATAAQFTVLLTLSLTTEGMAPILWAATLLSFVAACDYGWLFILELQQRAAEKSSAGKT